MTRRLTVALVGVAATALLIAGAGAYVLARLGAGEDARHQLEDQVAGLRAFGADVDQPVRRFRGLQRGLDIDGLKFFVAEVDGTISGPLPEGITASDIDLARLRTGELLSGQNGDWVWAVAGVPDGQRTGLVVLTRRVDTGLRPAAGWFALTAAVTVVLAALVAARLARRLTASLRATEVATTRMAGGDLTARVPVPERRDEVADVAASVNALVADLERAQVAEREFLLSISHDLRTPLTSVRGWAEVLAEGAVDDPAAAGRVIDTEARRLERLVTDLLDLAQVRAHHFSHQAAAVPVVEVADDVVRAAAAAAATSGVTLSIVDGGEQPVARADRNRVAQILTNLVENGVRHARSAVVITPSGHDGVVSIAVDDDGPGIAEQDRVSVFQPGWTSPGRARSADSTGMGLAIVAELCRAMGGSAEVQDSPLGGARLVARLPAV